MLKLFKQTTLIILLSFFSCSSNSNSVMDNTSNTTENLTLAKIVSVTTSGNENNYRFNVGISSPDTGCEQYANWWEVITENGDLIYRRILGHSHVNEQPFVRSGRSVAISENQTVIIRVHMNTTNYSIKAFKGSVSEGFLTFETAVGFAENLANQNPLPTGCAF